MPRDNNEQHQGSGGLVIYGDPNKCTTPEDDRQHFPNTDGAIPWVSQ